VSRVGVGQKTAGEEASAAHAWPSVCCAPHQRLSAPARVLCAKLKENTHSVYKFSRECSGNGASTLVGGFRVTDHVDERPWAPN